METDGSEQNTALWPIPAFHFKVVFGSDSDDAAFQEVSGIGSQIETEPFLEGGENRFTYQLPKSIKNSNLLLRRGITGMDSTLVKWCKSFFYHDFKEALKPKDLLVHLLDETGTSLRSWSLSNAYPVNWKMDSFNSTKNEVAIEEIELCYHKLKRIK